MFAEFGNKNNMVNQKENTVCLTFKVLVPHNLIPILESVYVCALICVQEMLKDRTKSSSKYYKEISCVVAKSLISKYQKNKKCKSVKNLTIPICGDKGKQVKIQGNSLRIPALFKKDIIPVVFPKPIIGFIRQVEFFKRNKKWYMSYSYNVKTKQENYQGVLGVDRNSVGNVVAVADVQTGKVLKLGPDCSTIKKQFRNRRGKLQKKKATEALLKLKRKQSRKTKDINHKVSRQLVNYAKEHCRAIVLEDLGSIRKGKAKKYVDKSQWAFFQLESFIKYKAALLGVPVFHVDPKNTSKGCSRCGEINVPKGKKFECGFCGHVDHRDVNAAFNIAKCFCDQASDERESGAGLIGNPLNWRLAHV